MKREDIIKKWEESGLLDDLKPMDEFKPEINLAPTIKLPDIKPLNGPIELEKVKQMDWTKEIIEEALGYEINKFKIQPHYSGNKLIYFSFNVEPRGKTEFINIEITISKSSEIKNEI